MGEWLEGRTVQRGEKIGRVTDKEEHWAGGWIAAGKNGRKCSGCQLFPKPLGDKDDETGKGGKLYLLRASYNPPKLR